MKPIALTSYPYYRFKTNFSSLKGLTTDVNGIVGDDSDNGNKSTVEFETGNIYLNPLTAKKRVKTPLYNNNLFLEPDYLTPPQRREYELQYFGFGTFYNSNILAPFSESNNHLNYVPYAPGWILEDNNSFVYYVDSDFSGFKDGTYPYLQTSSFGRVLVESDKLGNIIKATINCAKIPVIKSNSNSVLNTYAGLDITAGANGGPLNPAWKNGHFYSSVAVRDNYNPNDDTSSLSDLYLAELNHLVNGTISYGYYGGKQKIVPARVSQKIGDIVLYGKPVKEDNNHINRSYVANTLGMSERGCNFISWGNVDYLNGCNFPQSFIDDLNQFRLGGLTGNSPWSGVVGATSGNRCLFTYTYLGNGDYGMGFNLNGFAPNPLPEDYASPYGAFVIYRANGLRFVFTPSKPIHPLGVTLGKPIYNFFKPDGRMITLTKGSDGYYYFSESGFDFHHWQSVANDARAVGFHF